jgi:hypothetical protein
VGIIIDEDTLIATAIKKVNKSTIFTRDHKKAWEDLEEEERDWELFKAYFIEKYNNEEQYANKTTGRRGLQGIHHVNEEVDGNDDKLTKYLYELKVAATENSETIQQVNSKTLNVVAELTARIKTLTNTTASQQKNISSQQHTIARLMGNQNNNGNGSGTGSSTRSNTSRGTVQKKSAQIVARMGSTKKRII